MIPLGDTVPSKTFPFINYFLVAANVFFFLIELAQGPYLDKFIQSYGVVPYHFKVMFRPEMNVFDYVYFKYFPLLSSLFLHGGWFHLGGNMLFLWIFGDNVEDRLGHVRYLFFYLFCGIAASAAHIVMNFNSTIPSIGASGAIAGVLGAYLLLYPWARVRTLIIIFIFIDIIEIPAYLFIFFWFLIQLFSSFGSIMASPNAGGVAWFAHIGGFIAGFITVNIVKKRQKPRRLPRFQRFERHPW
ncbi:rhomboid family intramembrane serine protease [candidate division CSSED10-310 bacterium]|uniref:Rhomboid family intramembrane serine protease n=1 Tax=candidate division CSSED10-310 bacterium TaxID=2855610 RepID=A0ABV6YRK0_UNCC1